MKKQELKKGLWGLLVILCAFLGIFFHSAIRAGSPAAPVNDDYTGTPPFMMSTDQLLPNIIAIMDNGSYMANPAYCKQTDGDGNIGADVDFRQTVDGTSATAAYGYYGLFDNNTYYHYQNPPGVGGQTRWSSTGAIRNPDGTYNPKPADSYPGNLLNWATMSKWDVMKAVLVGGNVSNLGGGNDSEAMGQSNKSWTPKNTEWKDYGELYSGVPVKYTYSFSVTGGTQPQATTITITTVSVVASVPQTKNTQFAKNLKKKTTKAVTATVDVIDKAISVNVAHALANPVITSITPPSAPIGATVTLKGTNFTTVQGSVKFGTTAATITSWIDTQIVCIVPNGLSPGTVTVTVKRDGAGGDEKDGIITFIVIAPPNISSLSPDNGPTGTTISINGTKFGATTGTIKLETCTTTSGVTTCAYTTLTPSSWSDTLIKFDIPVGTPASSSSITHSVFVWDSSGAQSNNKTLTVTVPAAPIVTSYDRTSGPVDLPVTINGSNFGSTIGTVQFNGTTATIVSWNNTTIIANVPAGATTGPITVTNAMGTGTGPTFTVNTTPTITEIVPNNAAVGASVIIKGAGFGTKATGDKVVFTSDVMAVDASWSNTEIPVTVPSGAVSGEVKIHYNSGVVSNGVWFTVGNDPIIDTIQATTCNITNNKQNPVDRFTITGKNFGTTLTPTVTLGSTSATIESWSDTVITATISRSSAVSPGTVTSNDTGKTSASKAFTNVCGVLPVLKADIKVYYPYNPWGVIQELYMNNYETVGEPGYTCPDLRAGPCWKTDVPIPGFLSYDGLVKCLGTTMAAKDFVNDLRKIDLNTSAGSNKPYTAIQTAINYYKGTPPGTCTDPFGINPQWCKKNFVLFVGSGKSDSSNDLTETAVVEPIDPPGSPPSSPTSVHYTHVNDIRSTVQNDQVITFYNVSVAAGATDPNNVRNNLKRVSRFGGFYDNNNDKAWDTNEEYAKKKPDTSVEPQTDPPTLIPDTYFEPIGETGDDLAKQIKQAVSDIMARATSGTAVSVLATSAEGEGALFQAFFRPTHFEGTTPISWIGFLQGMFIDQYGNIREDDGDKALTAVNDYIVQIINDPAKGDAYGKLFKDSNYNGVAEESEIQKTGVPLNELNTLWEAGHLLAKMPATNATNGTEVRDIMHAPLSDGRAIFTNLSGVTGRVEFSATNINLGQYLERYIADGNVAEATDIMKFVRGANVTGLRNREMTLKDGTKGVWKLGDIIYSTPTVVSVPMENYDLIYEDITYYQFYDKHRNRATMVYAGANDGMLHAFYGGKFNQGDKPGVDGVIEMGWFTGGTYKAYPDPTSNSSVEIALAVPNNKTDYSDLGREVWGYIPQSYLPHLKWQTTTAYGEDMNKHVFGVDLKPKIADVRIFTPDNNVHVNGWGTVLIGGMRMGGGDIVANGKTFYSSYFALDVTDPFNPTVLWEFSRPDLGMPLNYPCIVKTKDDASNTEIWYAIFGTGPQRLLSGNSATLSTYHSAAGYYGFSDVRPKLYIVNIKTGAVTEKFLDSSSTLNGFVGNPINIDTNLDFKTDAIYTGTVLEATSPSADPKTRISQQTGGLYRVLTRNNINPGSWEISSVFTSNHALINPPAVTTRYDTLWLYLSSGRFLHSLDKETTTTPGSTSPYEYEALYGFKDPCYTAGTYQTTCPAAFADTVGGMLFDVTGTDVRADANKTVTGAPSELGLSSSATFDQLASAMNAKFEANSKYGWKVKMAGPYSETTGLSTGAFPSERGVSKPTLIGDVVLFTSYIPSSDICAGGGSGYIYTLYSLTGTAYKNPIIGTATFSGNTINRKWMSLGEGTPSSISVHMGREKGGKAYVQQSTGAIVGIEFTTAALAKSGFILWREKW